MNRDSSVIASICDNMYAQYQRYGKLQLGSSGYIDDVGWARSGTSAFNYVLGAGFRPDKAEARVGQVTNEVKGWNVNALWLLGPEIITPDITKLAVDCGWARISPCTGMACHLERPLPDPVLPEGLIISRANDEDSLRTWAGVYYSAAPPDYRGIIADIISGLGSGDLLPWHYYIGYLNGIAVTSSMVFVGAGVAGLYYIGTLPEYRKRGLGTLMTSYTMKQAQLTGNNLVVLQATDVGLPIYQRLGFRDYCKIEMLVMRT